MRPPTLDDVRAYWVGFGYDSQLHGSPDEFYDHFLANGWMVGKVAMKDWKAAARNWSRNEVKWGRGTPLMVTDSPAKVAAKAADSEKWAELQATAAREVAEAAEARKARKA